MWPLLLDMTKEESIQCLRNLELEAYAHLVSALRAQGPLNPDKRRLLKDSSQVLNITQDRHKAEIRRAVNDEKLNTIAYHVTGVSDSLDDWAHEGRRSVPLIPRMAPQTAYSAIADEIADNANQTNKQLPCPASTERKRAPSQPVQVLLPESSKGLPFRVPDNPKYEENKKRKLPICTENSSLAQHLLGPSKISRTQQIYRQRTKAMVKEQAAKNKALATKLPFNTHLQANNSQRLMNMSTAGSSSCQEETIEQIQNEINNYNNSMAQKSSENCSIDIDLARTKLPAASPKGSLGPNLTFKSVTPGSDTPKSVKVCPSIATKKSITTTKSPVSLSSQKLIVVSNAQTIQNSSILQKTLSIPLSKNLSLKNFEKFKIVTSSSQQNSLNSIKHKVVTVKTNSSAAKKVIPLSILNSKGGIKVLPIGGKIVGKTVTNTTSSPLYIVNTMGTKTNVTTVLHSQAVSNVNHNHTNDSSTPVANQTNSKENGNGKSSVLGDILKASGVTNDDLEITSPMSEPCNDSQMEPTAAPEIEVTTTEIPMVVEEEVEEKALPVTVSEKTDVPLADETPEDILQTQVSEAVEICEIEQVSEETVNTSEWDGISASDIN